MKTIFSIFVVSVIVIIVRAAVNMSSIAFYTHITLTFLVNFTVGKGEEL